MAPNCPPPFLLCEPQRFVVAGELPSFVLNLNPDLDGNQLRSDGGIMAVRARAVEGSCIGESCDKVLLQGHVSFRYVGFQAAGPILIHNVNIDDNSIPKVLPVKLRYQRCGWPGFVYVDGDSHLIVDGGNPFNLDIVAPALWTQVPSEFLPAEPATILMVVDVRVRACVARCCPDRHPQLTMYGTIDPAAAPGDRRIGVPRRATEVQIFSGSGGAPTASAWHWSSANGALNLGNFNVNAGFVNEPLRTGAAEALVFDGPNISDVMLVWTIR